MMSTYGMSLKPVLEATKGSAASRLPSKIISALERLDSWGESERFRGWDPHDALNSPLLRRLTLQSRFAGIFWVQLLKRSPINLRPLLAIPKGYNPTEIGLFLATYSRKHNVRADPRHRD